MTIQHIDISPIDGVSSMIMVGGGGHNDMDEKLVSPLCAFE